MTVMQINITDSEISGHAQPAFQSKASVDIDSLMGNLSKPSGAPHPSSTSAKAGILDGHANTSKFYLLRFFIFRFLIWLNYFFKLFTI